MSFLLRTNLEVALKDSKANFPASRFHEEIAKAFGADGLGDDIALPASACVVYEGEVFVCQMLKGGASFYLLKCGRAVSSAPNITIDVLIHAEEPDLEPEACAAEFCRRAKKADRLTRALVIEVPETFKVYPLIDGIPAMSDEDPFYFLATHEPRFAPKEIRNILLVAVIGIFAYLVGLALQVNQSFGLLGGVLADNAPGASIGIVATLLYETFTGGDAITIKLNDAVSREARRMKESRTVMTLTNYAGATPTLRSSRKGQDNE